jgi:hypothetical protein
MTIQIDELPRGCCIKCGTKTDLDRHHVVPRAAGGTNQHDNLVYLCREDHQLYHHGRCAGWWPRGHKTRQSYLQSLSAFLNSSRRMRLVDR